MGASCALDVQVQLAPAVWTSLTLDTVDRLSLRIKYGIDGNGPLDCVAGTGECAFALRNDAGGSGGQQGYYSPLHAMKRAGWTFGIPIRVVFTDSADAAKAVTSIARVGSVATVTTTAPHGYSSGNWITVAGASQADYNGVVQIAVTGASTFTYGVLNTPVTPATGTITVRKAYVKHRGKVHVIDPDAGQYGSQKVRVTAYDGIRDLAETEVRELGIHVGETETELVTAVLDAIPPTAQPVARDLDVGMDTLSYAFHDLAGGAKALSVIKDVAVDAYAMVALKGDGTLLLRNRHSRAIGASAYTFNNTMHGFVALSTLEQAINLVRVTIHPPTIDAAATTVLYADQTVRSIAAGATSEFWVTYRDPTDTKTLIGGLDIVDPLDAGVDYQGNAAADGSGAWLTSDLVVTVTPFGSAALLSITNTNATATIYLVDAAGAPFLQIRGKGVYDLGPQTYEAGSVQPYGTREFPITLKYQDDPNFAQSYAEFVEAQRHALSNQPQALEFIANASPALMTQALAREPGDMITVTEPVLGFTLVTAIIQAVEFEVTPGPWIRCRFGLAPTGPFAAWLWGIVGSSEWGLTTVYGF